MIIAQLSAADRQSFRLRRRRPIEQPEPALHVCNRLQQARLEQRLIRELLINRG
jgi:hypothetical protein